MRAAQARPRQSRRQRGCATQFCICSYSTAIFDWSTLEGFEWDAGNERQSEVKHAVSATEAEQVFFNQPLLVVVDGAHSHHEPRWHALGTTDTDRLLHITFTLRADGRLIRVISARDMHRKETNIYAQSH